MSPDPYAPNALPSKEPRDSSAPCAPRQKGQDEKHHSLLKRLWIYQKERFPLVKYGLLIAIFSGSAVGYGASLTNTRPTLTLALIAFLSTFAFFWQMRVADEFKDLAEDTQYRPYRPVPRGLVSLSELAIVGLASAGIQASLALWLAPPLLGFLMGIWAYFGLMCKEFFVRDWLRDHPIAYVLSHMVIVPLIGGYAVAIQTISQADMVLNGGPLPFLMVCFCNGLVIELGRKTRLPAGEEIGVETYSALWGLAMAVRLWLGSVLLTALFSLWAAWQINALAAAMPILAALLGWLGFKVWPWLGQAPIAQPPRPIPSAPLPWQGGRPQPRQEGYDLLDTPTALWTLGVYLGLGWMPWLLGGWPS